MQGEKVNGSIFFEKAFENGAKAVIVQGIEIENKILEKYKDKVIIKVEDTLEMLQGIARFKRTLYQIPIIGVTGSVGKTSTKDILASVMSQKYNTLKTEGNYNNHIGLPLTILRLRNQEAAVVEMGMNHLGEIRKLTNIAKPTISVITNVGTAHIGFLGSRENILKAKLEILEGMENDGVVVINNDNDMLHNWYLENKENYNIMTYGIENKSDIMAKNIVTNAEGSSFTVEVRGKECKVQIKIGGNHFILNALCAICVGLKSDISMEQIIKGIKEFRLTKNRMEILRGINNSKIINDCYNAGYDSMKAAIEYLMELSGGRKIAVLGDILELGDFGEEIHKKVGEEVYKNNPDILIIVGELAKFIEARAVEQGYDKNRMFSCETNDEAIKILKNIIKENDYILIKASNSMKFNEITNSIKEEN